MPGEGGGAIGTLGGVVDVALGRDRIIRHLAFGQFQPAQHDRQHIVEIMRNAAGQLPHGLHLLDLAQLAFLGEQDGGGAFDRCLQLCRAIAFGRGLSAGDGALAERGHGQPTKRDRAGREQDAEDRQRARHPGRSRDRFHRNAGPLRQYGALLHADRVQQAIDLGARRPEARLVEKRERLIVALVQGVERDVAELVAAHGHGALQFGDQRLLFRAVTRDPVKPR